jgi:hypothetical protein
MANPGGGSHVAGIGDVEEPDLATGQYLVGAGIAEWYKEEQKKAEPEPEPEDDDEDEDEDEEGEIETASLEPGEQAVRPRGRPRKAG